jgi:multimeric flavodoxin WrbA
MFLFDDYEKILRHILNANGVVLVAPNYINSISAPIKTLFDRFSYSFTARKLPENLGVWYAQQREAVMIKS